MFELLNFSRKKKMAVLSIRRDWGQNPCIVRLEVDDNLSDVSQAGYLASVNDSILSLNNGEWEWLAGDNVRVLAANNQAGDYIISEDLSELVPLGLSGGLSVLNDVAAAASGLQVDATPLTAEINRVTTAVAGASVLLPAALAGSKLYVINDSGADIQIFPVQGENLDGAPVNVSFSLPAFGRLTYVSALNGNWSSLLD
jgi:hypothetical protein